VKTADYAFGSNPPYEVSQFPAFCGCGVRRFSSDSST
jgi:hypothetical protein